MWLDGKEQVNRLESPVHDESRYYSQRRAFTGSSREAIHAGINAASEQMTKALMHMSATSEGTTSAGISLN